MDAEARIKEALDGNFWNFDEFGNVQTKRVPKDFMPNHGALYATEQRQASGKKNGKVLRPWQPIEDETLVQMKMSGKPWSEITVALRRASQTCFIRWIELSRERGLPRYIERPNAADKMSAEMKAKIVQMRADNIPYHRIAAELGIKDYIAKGYYHRFKKEVDFCGKTQVGCSASNFDTADDTQ